MGTLRPPYQQKYFFRPIGAFFLLKLKVTKSSPGQIAVKMSVASAPHRKGMQANHVAQGRSQLSVVIKN